MYLLDERSRLHQRPRLLQRLRAQLKQVPHARTADLGELLTGRKIDAEILDDLETRLITADVGAEATSRILDATCRKRWRAKSSHQMWTRCLRLSRRMWNILQAGGNAAITIDPPSSPIVILSGGHHGRRAKQ